ncbi:unnamed protein product [Lactuca saligna]|uniref:Uncharacterized protein n=1 Tax=Lactuca saligna TaxID=75948 RepID=A0AA35YTF3_LACSI|nr:unnamed protein product [Lactuca saligna]
MCYKPTPLLRILRMTNLTLKTVVALMIILMIHPGEMWLSGLMEGSSIRTEEPVSSSSSSLGAQCVPPNVYHIGYGAKIKRSKSKQLENEFNQLIHSEKDEMQDMQVDSLAIISLIVGANNQEEIVVESIEHAKEAIALDVKDGNSWCLANLLLLLLSFEKATGKNPLGIIFYRDDVSDGKLMSRKQLL